MGVIALIRDSVTQLARELRAADGDLSLYQDPTTSLGAATKQYVDAIIPPGYIDGLKMVWNSATSISVTSGACYIPSLGAVLKFPSTLTLSGLSLSASTFYHLYGYSNAGTAAIELVNTAPVIYNGTAYTKTGDTSRRYLGTILTDSSGNIYNFQMNDTVILYVGAFTGSSPFRALASGMATTSTAVSLTGVIPLTASLLYARIACTNTDVAGFSASVQKSVGSSIFTNINPKSIAYALFPVASQAIAYTYVGGTPTGGGMFIDVMGYTFER